MASCIFCGATIRKAVRSKEHVIPMWLLEATGDPHRKIRIEFDPDTGADIIRPASTFHFPACVTCNKSYGTDLEAKAQRAVRELSRRQTLTVSQCYGLLDWLDKVRVGLWLGYHQLHKDFFTPKFRIDGRIAKKDRIAIISVDPNDSYKGFGVGGARRRWSGPTAGSCSPPSPWQAARPAARTSARTQSECPSRRAVSAPGGVKLKRCVRMAGSERWQRAASRKASRADTFAAHDPA
jgi:hypothetical protein